MRASSPTRVKSSTRVGEPPPRPSPQAGEGAVSSDIARRLIGRVRDQSNESAKHPVLSEGQVRIDKLEVRNRVEAALRATREGLI